MASYGSQQRWSGPGPGAIVRSVLLVLVIVVLVIFLVDRFVLGPPRSESGATLNAIASKLEHRQVRRVTIPADRVTVELNDGSRMTARLTPDRDLWPSIRASGADIAIEGASNSDQVPLLSVLVQTLPLLVLALTLILVIRGRSRRT